MAVGAGGALNGAHGGGAYYADLAVSILGAVHNLDGFGVNLHLLRVGFVLGQVLHVDFTEVAQSGMQGDECEVYTLDFHAFHQLAAEVQIGCRSRYGALVAGKD